MSRITFICLIPTLLFAFVTTAEDATTEEVHPHAQQCIEHAKIANALESEAHLIQLYEDYRKDFSVDHDESETANRRKVFKTFLHRVQSLKQNKKVRWRVGITPLAHLTEEEVDLLHGVNLTTSENSLARSYHGKQSLQAGQVPKSFDWRDQNAVTPVHAQIGGTCWAHASVVPIEALMVKLKKSILKRKVDPVELSTQELIGCAYEHNPIWDKNNGGAASVAWAYLAKKKHLSYRYELPDDEFFSAGTCDLIRKYKQNALAGFKLTAFDMIEEDVVRANEQSLEEVIASYSPVTIVVASKDAMLSSYRGGDYDWRVTKCNSKSRHAMVIVGYTPRQYIIRNSWGSSWGDKGYLNWLRSSPLGFSCELFANMRNPVLEIDA